MRIFQTVDSRGLGIVGILYNQWPHTLYNDLQCLIQKIKYLIGL